MDMPNAGLDLRREGDGRLLLGNIKIHKQLRWPHAGVECSRAQTVCRQPRASRPRRPPRVAVGETIDIAVQWLVTDEYGVDGVPAM